MKRAILLLSLLATTSGSQAAIISSGPVNGLTTFTDTNTGYIWLRMDNFFNATTGTTTYTYNSMVSAAEAAGFTVSDSATVQQLLDTLPLGAGQWQSYADIMGYGMPRNLIWGALAGWQDGVATPYAWAFATNNQWNYLAGNDANCTVNEIGGCNPNPGDQDLGLWAYRTGNNVPEPISLALMGLGLAGLGAVRRKSKAA